MRQICRDRILVFSWAIAMCSIAVLFAVVLIAPTQAQSGFTSVSATVTDPLGTPYANATVQATLVPPPGGPSLTLAGNQFSADVSPTKTDANGRFSLLLADNTQIQCNLAACSPQTVWSFQVDSTGIAGPLGSGPQSIVSVQVTISGATQDISSQLSAAAPALLRPFLSSASCTLAAGTCSHSFPPGAFVTAPKCTASGTSVANAMAANATTSSVTVTSSSGADTQSVNIICAPAVN